MPTFAVVEMHLTPMEPTVATGVRTPQPVLDRATNKPATLATFGTSALATTDAIARCAQTTHTKYWPIAGVVQL